MDSLTLNDVWIFLKSIVNFQLFTVNNTHITVSSLFVFIIMLTLLSLLARFLSNLMANKFLARLRMSQGTLYTMKRITFYSLVLLSIIISLNFIGIDLSGLTVIFGLLSVGIGFGLQNITSNFISGIILLFERPIKVGDRVTVGDTVGDVVAINMRATTIRSLQNISIIVPNSEFISSRVVNWSHMDPKVRLDVEVGVSYLSDLDKVLKALSEVAEENKDVLERPAPQVMHMGFGDSAWNMQLRVWIRSPKIIFEVRSSINCAIVRKFREFGVEIPFPQRDINFRNPLPQAEQPQVNPEDDEQPTPRRISG
ncbi:MAG: mechanosensitive ion channel domain-containing protein [Calditrichia bacterium]